MKNEKQQRQMTVQERQKRQKLKEKLRQFDLGQKKSLSTGQARVAVQEIAKQERFKKYVFKTEAEQGFAEKHKIYTDVGFQNSQDATYDKIKQWIDENQIHSLNLMAVQCSADCRKIPGMTRGSGTQINKQAYFFPFVPIAFLTNNKGSFTPPKINLQRSQRKVNASLQAVSFILQGRTPWSYQRFLAKEAMASFITVSRVKMSTVISIIKSQTIAVTGDGTVLFESDVKRNLKAASINPLDYILQSQVSKGSGEHRRDWLQTKLQFKKLKFIASVTIKQNPEWTKGMLKKIDETAVVFGKIQQDEKSEQIMKPVV